MALAAIVAAAIQITAYRQANLGRQALARVEARWAARAGVEQIIAVLAANNEYPDVNNAFRVYTEMAAVSDGDLLNATYRIRHWADGQEWAGPMDEHSRVNLNLLTAQDWLNLDFMTEDMTQDIIAWTTEMSDEEAMLSAVSPALLYYSNAPSPYAPRQAPFRHVAELELVYNVLPDFVRGEDWNLNNVLDPNENDGDMLWPPDNANGVLEAGWSAFLTATSVDGGIGADGLPRLYLPLAEITEVSQRFRVNTQQAQALVSFSLNPANRLSQLFTVPLSHVREDGTIANINGPPVTQTLPLDTEQLGAVLNGATLTDPSFRDFGRMNLNTVSEWVLRDVLLMDPTLVDDLLYLRQRSSTGLTSIADLAAPPQSFTAQQLEQLADLFDVRSNVFTITSIGRSNLTGAEVQIIAVVDRSVMPIAILEYREP